jgi:hypothetical protein
MRGTFTVLAKKIQQNVRGARFRSVETMRHSSAAVRLWRYRATDTNDAWFAGAKTRFAGAKA